MKELEAGGNKIIPIKMAHSFCAAKWYWVTLHFGMKSNHSCYHPTPQHWSLDDIKDNPSGLHNTAWKKEQRKQMLTGERPKECHYCWTFEDLNKDLTSDRMVFNGANGTFGSDIPETVEFDGTENINPRYMEVSFNHRCNLACSYCSPGQSSRWHEEIRKFGGYPVKDATVRHLHDNVPEDENPYIEAFWKWLPDCYDGLRYLRITGGEPLMSHSADKLLDYAANNENKQLTIAYNTNLCTPDRRIDHLIEQANRLKDKVETFRIYTSCDTVSTQAEFIRHGFEWDRWCVNTERVARAGHPVNIMCTFGMLSIFRFPQFIDKVLSWRHNGLDIKFSCAALVDPKHFDVRLLPDEYDYYWHQLANKLESVRSQLTPQEIRTLENMIALRKSKDAMDQDERADLLNEFKIFFAEHDRRRNTSLLTAFPELQGLYAQANTQ